MKLSIPLFPLNLVVYPNSSYPLHIFEERYKILVNSCLATGKGFGIVPIIQNEIANVGSYVNVTSVLKKYSTGEIDIVVTGRYKFNIYNISLHKNGYHIGDIQKLKDFDNQTDLGLVDKLKNEFETILEKTDLELETLFWDKFEQADLKSYKLAEKAGLDIEQQKELLSMTSENERLKFLIDHFENLEKRLTKNAVIKNLISHDGYLN